MGRVAAADHHVSDDETAKMVEVVRERGHLSEEQAVLVVELAKTQQRLFGGTEDFLVTREFRTHATDSQRQDLLDCLFAVSAVDSRITPDEDSQIRQIANELGFDHQAFMGTLVTDFTMIKPGALHRANGGYLIFDARKLLMQPYAWECLKRVLQAGEIRIESLERSLSLTSSSSLEPEPIPLNVKLIIYGDRLIYYLLSQYDPEFQDLFKVAADFDDSVKRDSNELEYARKQELRDSRKPSRTRHLKNRRPPQNPQTAT